MIRALIAIFLAAIFASSAGAAPRFHPPGKRIEGGMEKDYRFQTYLVSRKRVKGARAFTGEVHMRLQDISGGLRRSPHVRKWRYIARCEGSSGSAGLLTRGIRPLEKEETFVQVAAGQEPGTADRTWYNVWHAVCRGEFNKYPRNQE